MFSYACMSQFCYGAAPAAVAAPQPGEQTIILDLAVYELHFLKKMEDLRNLWIALGWKTPKQKQIIQRQFQAHAVDLIFMYLKSNIDFIEFLKRKIQNNERIMQGCQNAMNDQQIPSDSKAVVEYDITTVMDCFDYMQQVIFPDIKFEVMAEALYKRAEHFKPTAKILQQNIVDALSCLMLSRRASGQELTKEEYDRHVDRVMLERETQKINGTEVITFLPGLELLYPFLQQANPDLTFKDLTFQLYNQAYQAVEHSYSLQPIQMNNATTLGDVLTQYRYGAADLKKKLSHLSDQQQKDEALKLFYDNSLIALRASDLHGLPAKGVLAGYKQMERGESLAGDPTLEGFVQSLAYLREIKFPSMTFEDMLTHCFNQLAQSQLVYTPMPKQEHTSAAAAIQPQLDNTHEASQVNEQCQQEGLECMRRHVKQHGALKVIQFVQKAADKVAQNKPVGNRDHESMAVTLHNDYQKKKRKETFIEYVTRIINDEQALINKVEREKQALERQKAMEESAAAAAAKKAQNKKREAQELERYAQRCEQEQNTTTIKYAFKSWRRAVKEQKKECNQAAQIDALRDKRIAAQSFCHWISLMREEKLREETATAFWRKSQRKRFLRAWKDETAHKKYLLELAQKNAAHVMMLHNKPCFVGIDDNKLDVERFLERTTFKSRELKMRAHELRPVLSRKPVDPQDYQAFLAYQQARGTERLQNHLLQNKDCTTCAMLGIAQS